MKTLTILLAALLLASCAGTRADVKEQAIKKQIDNFLFAVKLRWLALQWKAGSTRD